MKSQEKEEERKIRIDKMRLDNEEERKHNWEKIEESKKEERSFKVESLRNEEQKRLNQEEPNPGHYLHPYRKTAINHESNPEEERQPRLNQVSPSDRPSSEDSEDSRSGDRSDFRRRKRNDDQGDREDQEKNFQRQRGLRGHKKVGDEYYVELPTFLTFK